MSLQLVHFSSCGPVRATNQDAYCIRVSAVPSGFIAMVLVCDGMGGMNCGEVASATLSTAFGTWFDTHMEGLLRRGLTAERIAADWNRIVRQTHSDIKEYAAENHLRIGTTLSVILIAQGQYYLMHVGDSRIYLDDGQVIRQLTKDQTLAMREFEAGRITEDEYRSDRRHNVLLQCVGDLTVSPVFLKGNAPRAGGVLLCSDGFYHTVCPSELHSAMISAGGKTELQRQLLNYADRGRLRGENDNMTCVAFRWCDTPDAFSSTMRMDGISSESVMDSIAKITFTNADTIKGDGR